MSTRSKNAELLVAQSAVRCLHGKVDEAAILEIVQSVLRPGKQLNLVTSYLEEHPDGLVSGSSLAPPGLRPLAEALRLVGFVECQVPRCARCAKERDLRYHVKEGRICTPCFNRSNARACSRCKKVAPVSTNDKNGPVCYACRRKDPAAQSRCIECGNPGIVARRTDAGAICMRCYQRPKVKCDVCGEFAQIHSRRSGRAVCDSCYSQPLKLCSVCGELGKISKRGRQPDEGDVCEGCYEYPVAECAGCGLSRRVAQRTAIGPLCQACAVRPTRRCVDCDRDLPAHQITERGPICSTCYKSSHQIECRGCGAIAYPYEKGLCARCVLERRLQEVLGGEESDIRLEPVRLALLDVANPEASIGWLRKSSAATTLGQIARREVELSHQGLDGLEQTKPLNHLRGLLVAAGALPEYQPGFDRLEAWLEDLLADVPSDRANLVRPFAVWHVLRRARRRVQRGQFTENGAKWARLRISQSLAFLSWLDESGRHLEGLRQADVDLWLSSGPTTRYAVRDFLAWARSRKLISGVRVPLRQSITATSSVEEDERWEQVERLLAQSEIDLALRVAGLFVLLFGQHLSRVVGLRSRDVREAPGSVFVNFGVWPLQLPPVLDDLVLQLRGRRGHSTVHRGDWLFPGGVPGRPITTEQLRNRLATLGIVLRPTRNSALMQLASELQAPVLADLLGLHVNTAVEWVRNSRGDWARYAASGAEKARRDARSLSGERLESGYVHVGETDATAK